MNRPDPSDLLPALETLAVAVGRVDLPLRAEGVDQVRAEHNALRDQLADYVLPRLRSLDAPLLAVVGGSTGAGKSTLVNSLLRQQVTRSGVLRPTTRAPVLVHHPDDASWFTGARILPGMARVTGSELEHGDGARTVRLVASESLRPGLAILDAPDVDSVVRENRDLASQLLAAADLWLFVTTASRYADAVPWDVLRTAADRGTTVALVLDRVPSEAHDEVRTHLAQMLGEAGLAGAPLFTVPEVAPVDGLLPPQAVAPLRTWLDSLASSDAARSAVVTRTLSGALDSLQDRVPAVAAGVDTQLGTAQDLRRIAAENYAASRRQIQAALTDGTLLRGEVLARWQEFVGTGEFFRAIESKVGRVRDRMTAVIRRKPTPAEPLGDALQSGVETLVQAQIEIAADRTDRDWREHPAGEPLLADRAAMSRPPLDLPERLARAVRDWQRGVLELVTAEGEGKRTAARALSYGVNGLGVTLMLVVFTSTAGLTGTELGIAAGSAALAQRLLEAVFGDQAVRELAAKARRDLTERVDVLLAADRARFEALLEELPVDAGIPAALRSAVADVAAAR